MAGFNLLLPLLALLALGLPPAAAGRRLLADDSIFWENLGSGGVGGNCTAACTAKGGAPVVPSTVTYMELCHIDASGLGGVVGEHNSTHGCRGYGYDWQINPDNVKCGCKRTGGSAYWATVCKTYASLPSWADATHRICRKLVAGDWRMGSTQGPEMAFSGSGYWWMQACYVYPYERYPEHDSGSIAYNFEYLCQN